MRMNNIIPLFHCSVLFTSIRTGRVNPPPQDGAERLIDLNDKISGRDAARESFIMGEVSFSVNERLNVKVESEWKDSGENDGFPVPAVLGVLAFP